MLVLSAAFGGTLRSSGACARRLGSWALARPMLNVTDVTNVTDTTNVTDVTDVTASTAITDVVDVTDVTRHLEIF